MVANCCTIFCSPHSRDATEAMVLVETWPWGPLIVLIMPVLIQISLVFLSRSSLHRRKRESTTCQHAWLIFQLNYFQRKFPEFLTMWQENASHLQKHAVDLLPWMPILHDFLHVYPSQPNAILFHLKRDNHLDVLPRSVYQFIVGAQHTFKGWLSFKF